MKWYRMAAEQGSATAQCNLACMYEDGTGVPQSDDEAARWFKMSAERGILMRNLISVASTRKAEAFLNPSRRPSGFTGWLRNRGMNGRRKDSVRSLWSLQGIPVRTCDSLRFRRIRWRLWIRMSPRYVRTRFCRPELVQSLSGCGKSDRGVRPEGTSIHLVEQYAGRASPYIAGVRDRRRYRGLRHHFSQP